jgi:hypothetical protein
MNDTIASDNKVPISIYSIFNIYVYRPRDLWLAYGIAIAASFLCMILGVYAMWRNGGCYQTTFSTFIRVTNDENLLSLISTGDRGGEPLPKDLAEARVVLGG